MESIISAYVSSCVIGGQLEHTNSMYSPSCVTGGQSERTVLSFFSGLEGLDCGCSDSGSSLVYQSELEFSQTSGFVDLCERMFWVPLEVRGACDEVGGMMRGTELLRGGRAGRLKSKEVAD